MIYSYRSKQSGLVTVEFALIGAVFLFILLGIIEMGRFLYTWNVLDEVTRRAARLAAVCPMTSSDDVNDIKKVAVFRTPSRNSLIAGLEFQHVNIEYLRADFTTIDPGPDAHTQVRYVRASMLQGANDFQYRLLIPPLIPGLDLSPFSAADFTTTLPSESLGIKKDPSHWDVQC
jgi:Flp pilus assembly protein TadG